MHLGLIAFVACPVDYCGDDTKEQTWQEPTIALISLFCDMDSAVQLGIKRGLCTTQSSIQLETFAATRAAKKVGPGTFVYGQGSILSSRHFTEIKE
jgi:hypothetical protein